MNPTEKNEEYNLMPLIKRLLPIRNRLMSKRNKLPATGYSNYQNPGKFEHSKNMLSFQTRILKIKIIRPE